MGNHAPRPLKSRDEGHWVALTSATTGAPATSKGFPQLQRSGLGAHGDPDSCCRVRARRRVCPSSVGPNSPRSPPRAAGVHASSDPQCSRRPPVSKPRTLADSPGRPAARSPGRPAPPRRALPVVHAPHLCRAFPASGLWSTRGTLRAPAIFKGPEPEASSLCLWPPFEVLVGLLVKMN